MQIINNQYCDRFLDQKHEIINRRQIQIIRTDAAAVINANEMSPIESKVTRPH